MRLIINHSIDPAFNLALEEYALTQMNQDVIMLWRNKASIIIGRNQNAVEEMNMDFVRDNGITVIRRQSGGGAVFHDLGNINFTVIHALEQDDFSNYAKFTAPVVEFLQGLGVDACLSGRNDLVIGQAKFSGNAQAVKGGRIMHHGTILFNADVSWLAEALRPSLAKIESRGVKSVRGRVTNVADHLPQNMTVEQFFEQLTGFFRARTEGEYALSPADIDAVRRLVEKKYATWEWNIGKSPAYGQRKSERFPFGTVDIRLSIEHGAISEAHIFGDFFGIREINELEARLNGIRHDKEIIQATLSGLDLGSYIHGITTEQFINLF